MSGWRSRTEAWTCGIIRSAKDYGPTLARLGFEPVPLEGYKPEAADIVVLPALAPDHPDGHIAGYDGEHWVSDFVQRDIWAGPAWRNARPEPIRALFRFPTA